MPRRWPGRLDVSVFAVSVAVLGLASTGFAQPSAAGCADQGGSDRISYCEVRQVAISVVNPLEIDARPNGGIRVRGWDGSEALLYSRVVGYADTEADARRIVAGVQIVTTGGAVHAEGPERSENAQWQVSYELQVPRSTMTATLTLTTTNGGITMSDFRGAAAIHVKNGGVTLRDVGGDIHGETTNGGVNIDLSGDRWDGTGLDVETHNGGIRISMPKDYSAALEIGTTRGRVTVDFPITMQGTISSPGRHIETVLGAGGARIRAITVNGGVTVRQK